jgi:hypothetical protein
MLALLLLDYASYPVKFPETDSRCADVRIIEREYVMECLKVPGDGEEDIEFTEDQKYIRDCFDELFVSLTKIAILVNRDEVDIDDFDTVFGFFIARMKVDWNAFENYLHGFFYDDLLGLINDHWKKTGEEKYKKSERRLIKDKVKWRSNRD